MRKKRKGRLTPDDWKRIGENSRLLRERIEYHRAKLIEENPGWTPPASDEEWQALHEARIATGKRTIAELIESDPPRRHDS